MGSTFDLTSPLKLPWYYPISDLPSQVPSRISNELDCARPAMVPSQSSRERRYCMPSILNTLCYISNIDARSAVDPYVLHDGTGKDLHSGAACRSCSSSTSCAAASRTSAGCTSAVTGACKSLRESHAEWRDCKWASQPGTCASTSGTPASTASTGTHPDMSYTTFKNIWHKYMVVHLCCRDPPPSQAILDRSTPHVLYRWLAWGFVCVVYAVRVFNLEG